jgi:DNA-binding response OmpR family regulator
LDVSPKKILVAEGDEIVLVLISALLHRYSYAVDRASNAAEAEERLSNQTYHAVLLDLNLRDGGSDFLRRMIAKFPSLGKKLIVLTARIDDARYLSDLPVAAILRKPVEIYELLETVNQCLRGERE